MTINEKILKRCETDGFDFQRAFIACLRMVVTRRRQGCNSEQTDFWMSVATDAQKEEAYFGADFVVRAIPLSE